MEAFTANDARIHLGDILLKSQKMPVQITRSGKPVAVVVSMEDYQTFEQLKMQALQARVKEAEEDEAAGRVADGETRRDFSFSRPSAWNRAQSKRRFVHRRHELSS